MDEKKNLTIWLIPLGIGACVILCMLALMLRTETPPEPAEVKLANVEVITLVPQEFHETLELPARVIADQSVTLSAESFGRLDEWVVDEGAAVKKGDVLALINADELSAMLGEAKARLTAGASQVRAGEAALTQSRTAVKTAKLGLKAAESDLEFRTKEYQRVKKLFDENVVPAALLDGALNDLNQSRLGQEQAVESVTGSQQQVASAEAALALAESQLVQVEKSVELLTVQLEKTRIKAPFSGRVDKQLIDVGGLVSAGTPVISIYDVSHIRAVVNVADRYVAFLDKGNEAVERYLELTLPGADQKISSSIILPGMPKLTGGTFAGVELPAEIARVGQASDPVSNTFEVELRMANPGEALKQGIIVKARLGFLTYREALVVPLRSLSVTDAGTRLLVAEKDGDTNVARVRPVIPLSIHGKKVLISGDLQAGEKIIVAGGKGVVDGEQVKVLVVNGELAGINPVKGDEE